VISGEGSMNLTAKPVHPQLQKWIDNYVVVFDREPSAEEITAFEELHGLTNSIASEAAPADATGSRAGVCEPNLFAPPGDT
jgi:hypothetical protein